MGKANFKLTVAGRVAVLSEEVTSRRFCEIVKDVFANTELEPRSHADYEKDIIELAARYRLEIAGNVSNLIPDLQK